MINLNLSTGGFPLTNNRIETIQKAYMEVRAILSLMGNKVIVTGTDGTKYGIVDGNMYRIVAGSGNMYKLTEEETKVTYADGEEKTFSVETVLKQQTVGDYAVADFVTVSTPLASLGPAISSNSGSIGSIETRLGIIEGILNELGDNVGGAISTAASASLPVGSIIMFGKQITWNKTTLDDIKTKSGIPYGYIPAGDIFVTLGARDAKVETAWNAYLAELGVTNRLSGYSLSGKLNFSACLANNINLSNKLPMGADSYTTALGKTGGRTEFTMQLDNLPSHRHTLGDSTNKVYTATGTSQREAKSSGYYGISDPKALGATGFAGNSSPSAINILNPYCAVYYLIKMK